MATWWQTSYCFENDVIATRRERTPAEGRSVVSCLSMVTNWDCHLERLHRERGNNHLLLHDCVLHKLQLFPCRFTLWQIQGCRLLDTFPSGAANLTPTGVCTKQRVTLGDSRVSWRLHITTKVQVWTDKAADIYSKTWTTSCYWLKHPNTIKEKQDSLCDMQWYALTIRITYMDSVSFTAHIDLTHFSWIKWAQRNRNIKHSLWLVTQNTAHDPISL